MTVILVYGYFENSTDLDGETGLTPVVDLFAVPKADPSTSSQVVTTGSAVEIGNGIYAYRYGSADLETNEYVGTFLTSSSDVVSKEVPVLKNEVLDQSYEGTRTLRGFLRLAAAVLFNKSDGGGSTTGHFRDEADSLDRVEVVRDIYGNRTSVTLDDS